MKGILHLDLHKVKSPNLQGEGYIDFCADPVGISISLGMTLVCTISCETVTEFLPWIHNWDITKNRLDFGDLDLILKLIVLEKLKILGGWTSFWKHHYELSLSCKICIGTPEKKLAVLEFLSVLSEYLEYIWYHYVLIEKQGKTMRRLLVKSTHIIHSPS